MRMVEQSNLVSRIQEAAIPLDGTETQFDPLLRAIGQARIVLLGESTHGTHEFYKTRAHLTQRLIHERGFNIIAWEADWPDALRLNRYIQGRSEDTSARAALESFTRYPVWMWRNTEILELIEALRRHNAGARSKAGVYGLDLYSLHSSMHAVVEYLDKVNPEAAREARQRYSCFEDFGEDPQSYGMTASIDRSLSCEDEVVRQLVELQQRGGEFLQRDGKIAQDELFYAEQNALVARNAEKYYRAMYRGRPNTWNLRDTHMVETLDNIMAHVQKQGEQAKAVVWAHNSHLGDARATQMSRRGELNIGQLARERHGGAVFSVGFTTYSGWVTASDDWGGITKRKRVRPGMEGSYERLFHETGIADFALLFKEDRHLSRELNKGLLERAIGVIYLPETERYSHYFVADIADQFDAVIHFDESSALEPLDRTSGWDEGELPETYPTGF